MVRFHTLAAMLLSAQACVAVTPENLRPRKLSGTSIAGYHPSSTVTDHAALDQDQVAMASAISLGTEDGLQQSRKIYTMGGNSKSFAVLTLNEAITTAANKGEAVSGTDDEGKTVTGTIYADAPAGATEIKVQYSITEDRLAHVGCRVGGLTNIVTEGCFMSTGTVMVGDETLNYSYDVTTDNMNGRTLSGFSIAAEAKMYRCDACPYSEYEKYYNYYKAFDYSDQYVLGALDQQRVNFANNGKDFSRWNSIVARGEAAKKGSQYMGVYMYVIRELEDAKADCKAGCMDCNDDPVHAWDEGVAFYTGSLEGSDGSGDGDFLYSLADKRCSNFMTCGENSGANSGTAKVNHDIFDLFAEGQGYLSSGQCDKLTSVISDITTYMRIPLVQGSLRYAYKVAELNGGEKEKAEGDVFTAAILPVVHDCNPNAASVIERNMDFQSTRTDQAAVKTAYESVYSCMGISCADVGGLFNAGTGTDYPGASACVTDGSSGLNSGSFATNSIFAVVLGSVAGLFALVSV
mmetsp:Transcript_3758/g.5526  ORF Transcript_3758/g.5526 Transcript_3758/m.5526 type:complete len:519 (+) Transcript_3758:80-1636(+)|eukprot:CAMPEP_0195521910 /NCGR_PEP_ID=MMETSP0794_2-20130614/19655_1 /TAXON_ID=515487 /ORGANISM="Stephanopyxis turris, Strain CCMP 815" /LENGTH=518 /DNA_ID=CAMNT_0040651561 /DNA_START=80 /DNA_END=1636 /DNA_ORIENTATION=-